MVTMRFAVVLALLTACIEPTAAVQCGDLICPPTSVCLPNNTCVPHDDVAACDGLTDGAACQTSVFMGTCRTGACFPPTCGDGLVEGSEQCDGSVTGVDCVLYGFDTGLPECTNCVLDVINSCVRFGWRLVNSTIANGMWTDGDRLAIIRRDNTGIDMFVGNQPVGMLDAPDYYFIAGNASTIAVASAAAIQLFTGTQFTPIDVTPLGLGANNFIQRVQIDTAGALYVETVGPSSCAIWSRTPSGAWTAIRTSASTNDCQLLLVEDGQVLLAITNGTGAKVMHWNGSQWLATGFAPTEHIFDMHTHAGAIYAVTATKVATYIGGATTVYDEPVAQVVPLDSGLYAGGGGGNAVDRLESTTWLDAIDAPIQGNLYTDGHQLFIYGNGIYVYSGLQYAIRFSPSTVVNDLSLLENGMPVAVGLNQAMVPMAQNRISWDYTMLLYDAHAVAGIDDNNFFVTDGTHIDHVANHTPTPVTTQVGANLHDLWMAGTTLYAIGDNQSFYMPASTLIPLMPPAGLMGCVMTSISGNATDVFVSAVCGTGGSVWQLAGNAWTEVHHTTVRLAAVAADAAGDLFTCGPDGGVRFVQGAWADDPSAVGLSISVTTPNDVWVSGGPSPVLHWDGTAWSRLGVTGAERPRVVATPSEVTISGVSQPVLLR